MFYNAIMDPAQVISQAKQKFQLAVDRFNEEIKKVRTGRANAAILDNVTVEAYGTVMPLKQTATVVAPEAQLLQVTPFDQNNLQAITTAIRNDSSLGLNPTDDGHIIRIPIPPLTEERRRDLARQISAKQEEALVAMRGARHDSQSHISRLKKEKGISEDEARRLEKQIDEAMNASKEDVESVAKAKESEILSL